MSRERRCAWSLAGALALASVSAALDPNDLEIRTLFEEEIFRAGGPQQDRLRQLYQQVLAAGDVDTVRAVDRYVARLVDRRLVDPSSFCGHVLESTTTPKNGTSAAHASEAGRGVRQACVLWNLGAKTRETLYRRLIEGRGAEYGLFGGQIDGMNWVVACSFALHEHMDGLLPAVEGALAAQQEKDPAALSMIEGLRAVDVPLARARLSRDWVSGYVDLIRGAMGAAVGSEKGETYRDELVWDALAELLRQGRRDVVNDLIAIRSETRKAPLASAESVDPDRPTIWRTPRGALLVRGIRALGQGNFEKDSWRRWYVKTPEETERLLVERGVLKPRVESRVVP